MGPLAQHPPHPQPPESGGRSTHVGSRNSATSVRGPAGAKRGGGRLASLCRSLPGLGTMAREWGWIGGREGGGGTENRARGRSQTSARESLLFAPSVLLRSRAREPVKRRPSAKTKQSKREETAEGQSRGEGNRVSGKGSEQRPRRRGTEGLRGGASESRGGNPWGPGGICWCQEVLERPARAHGVLTVPSGPCGRRSAAGLRCAGTGRPAAGGESARLRSAGGERNLRS